MNDKQQMVIDALQAQLKVIESQVASLEKLESEQNRRVEETKDRLRASTERLFVCRAALEAYEKSLQESSGA